MITQSVSKSGGSGPTLRNWSDFPQKCVGMARVCSFCFYGCSRIVSKIFKQMR